MNAELLSHDFPLALPRARWAAVPALRLTLRRVAAVLVLAAGGVLTLALGYALAVLTLAVFCTCLAGLENGWWLLAALLAVLYAAGRACSHCWERAGALTEQVFRKVR